MTKSLNKSASPPSRRHSTSHSQSNTVALGDLIIQGINGGSSTASTETVATSSITSSNQPPTTKPPAVTITPVTIQNGSTFYHNEPQTYRPSGPISWASPMPDVEKCWSDITTWRSYSVSWYNAHAANSSLPDDFYTTLGYAPLVTPASTKVTSYPATVSTYELCDGSARADVRPITSVSTWNTTQRLWYNVPRSMPHSAQPCLPDATTCRKWFYDSNINVTNVDELYEQCGNPTGLYQPCILAGGPIEMIYFPVDNGDADPCPNNATVFPMTRGSGFTNTTVSKGPEVITSDGHTFTSGSVYLSFQTLYATWDGFYDRIGPAFSDYIVAVPSSAMSTHCGGWGNAYGPGTSLNFADLNWPVAASAYDCQARCDQFTVNPSSRTPTPSQCSTIWSDVNPNIAVPTMVRDMVPEWAQCQLSDDRYWNFWFDPPKPLHQVASIAAVTTAVTQPTPEPASPISTFTSPIATETGSSQTPSSGDPGASDGPSKTPSQQSTTHSSDPGAQSVVLSTVESTQAVSSSVLDPTTPSVAFSDPASASPSWQSASFESEEPSDGSLPTVAFSTVPLPSTISAGGMDPLSTSEISSTATLAVPVVETKSSETHLSSTEILSDGNPSPTASANKPSTLMSASPTTASADALSVLASAMTAQSGTETVFTLSFDPTTSVATAWSPTQAQASDAISTLGTSADPVIAPSVFSMLGSTSPILGTGSFDPGHSSATISGEDDGIPSSGTPVESSSGIESLTNIPAPADPTTVSKSGGSASIVVATTATLVEGGSTLTVVGETAASNNAGTSGLLTAAATAGSSIVVVPVSSAQQVSQLPSVAGSPAASPSSVLVATDTTIVAPIPILASDASAATIGGHTFSRDSSSLYLVEPHTTQAVSVLPLPTAQSSVQPGLVTLAAGNLTVVASQNSESPGVMVMNSQTLSAGGEPATIPGAVVSLGSSGLVALVASTTSIGETATSQEAPEPTLLAAGSVTVSVHAVQSNTKAMSVAGTTLSIGGPALTMSSSIVLSQGASGLVMMQPGSTQQLGTTGSQQTTNVSKTSSPATGPSITPMVPQNDPSGVGEGTRPTVSASSASQTASSRASHALGGFSVLLSLALVMAALCVI